MITNDLRLLPRWIRTDSLDIHWHNNEQMQWRHGIKDDKAHGDSRGWYDDGSVWFHEIWKNGRVVKTIV